MGWFSKLVYGVDLEAEQTRSNQLDAQLQSVNQNALDDGKITQEVYNQTEQHIQDGKLDVNGEVTQAFKDGLADGVKNVKGTIGATISFPFKLIPWQLWAVGAVALFFYMGGAVMLKGILKQK